MATFFDRMRSGWGVVWHVTVEGIPVVWCERALSGLTLASGFTADASLVLDGSAEVGSLADRNTGIGAGLPLTVRLRDTTTARLWSRSPSVETSLTASLTAASTSIPVDDGTGFAASGVVWVGTEAIAYTGNTGTSLTGLTRGYYQSRKLSHSAAAIVASVGDRPRQWRGRMVELRAVLVTPDGQLDAAGALADLGKVVWRGWVSTEPRRSNGGFTFEALALDRVLDRPLATGSAATIEGTGNLFAIDPSFTFGVTAVLRDATGTALYQYKIVCSPFAGLAYGTLKTTAEGHALIQSSWATAVAATLDTIGGVVYANTHFRDTLEFLKVTSDFTIKSNQIDSNIYGSKPKSVTVKAGAWSISGRTVADAAVTTVDWLCEVGGVVTWDILGNGPGTSQYSAGLSGTDQIPLGWTHGGDPQSLALSGQLSGSGCAVRLDDVLAVPPQPGLITVEQVKIPYATAEQDGNVWHLTGANVPGSLVGKKCELSSTTSGFYADLMRNVIGSCDGASVSVWDTLGVGNGYGIPDDFVDLDSFDQQAMGALVYATASLESGAGQSAASLFGGALVLSQRCIVLREEGPDVDSPCRLGLVSCEPGGSGWTDAIGDDDLLSVGSDPIEVLDLRDQPTGVRATFRPAATATEGLIVTVMDGPEMALGGGAVAEVQLLAQADDPAEAAQAVTTWAASLLRTRRTVQAIDVMLPPWRDVRIGGVLAVDLSHPDIWDPLTGLTRITGLARVIGVARNPTTCAIKATLLVASSDVADLCPSILIQSFTGPAGAPLTLTVSTAAAAMLAENATAAGTATIELQHTIPGDANEGGGGSLTVSVDLSGTLTVTSSASLGDPLTAGSYLTFMPSASADAFQVTFAHADAGQVWS